jgi:hypothetical protein
LPSNNSGNPDRRIMELEDQVKFLMKSYEAPKPSSQMNKITSSCKFCSGPHETHNCMELPKRAFKEFASSRADKTEDRWPTTNRGPRNFGEAYEAWKDKPNFRGYQTLSVSFNDSPHSHGPSIIHHRTPLSKAMKKHCESSFSLKNYNFPRSRLDSDNNKPI